MEWVHTRGRTVQEAVDKALDQLGVLESETELEILVEPKKGMFGKLGAVEAEIRVRVKPISREKPQNRRRSGGAEKPSRNRSERNRDGGRKRSEAAETAESKPVARNGGDSPSSQRSEPREPKETKRSRTPRAETGSETVSNESATASSTPIPEQAEIVTEFVTSVVSAFGVEGTVSSRIEDDAIYVDVAGENLGLLVGPKGATLAALEDLMKVILQRRADGDGARVRLDIGGYQQRRRDALSEFVKDVAAKVVASGEPMALAPMHPADRKLVHDTLSEVDGVQTESQGADPNRRIIVRAS